MKILYLTYHGLSENSGISKKMLAQVEGLRQNGHDVYFCTYIVDEDGQRKRMVNDICIDNYGKGTWAKIKKRFCYDSIALYAIEKGIEFVYIRSFNNANPMTIKLVKRFKKSGMKVVMEIPTYPYDQEYVGFSFFTRLGIKIDQLYRHQLASYVDRIVTFSDEKNIFGQQTIRISNGVNFDSIPLHKRIERTTNDIHLIGVAEVHYWHGYDRLIAGIGKYYQNTERTYNVHFHIIGGIGPSEMNDSIHAPGFKNLIKKYNIQDYIHFHGPKYGEDLNELFNQSDFAIGSLGRHRSNIDKIKTLKNREYAARGIPFVYSETDEDFDSMPYILKVPANDTPINIKDILTFYQKNKFKSSNIRNTILHLSWKEQMNTVINNCINDTKNHTFLLAQQ